MEKLKYLVSTFFPIYFALAKIVFYLVIIILVIFILHIFYELISNLAKAKKNRISIKENFGDIKLFFRESIDTFVSVFKFFIASYFAVMIGIIPAYLILGIIFFDLVKDSGHYIVDGVHQVDNMILGRDSYGPTDYEIPDEKPNQGNGIHHVDPHWVDGYDRSDGTHVDGYWRGADDGYYRSNPDGIQENNLNYDGGADYDFGDFMGEILD